MKSKITKITIILLISILMIFSLSSVRAYYENTSSLANNIDDTGKEQISIKDFVGKNYQARDIATYNNVYCVWHKQLLDNVICNDKTTNATVKGMVEIIGNKATFYNVDSEGKKGSKIAESNDPANNVMAGILTVKNPARVSGKDKNGKTHTFDVYKGYGALTIDGKSWRYTPGYTITQVAVHIYYKDNWFYSIPSSIRTAEKIFTQDDWTTLDTLKEKKEAAEQLIQNIANSNKTYSAKIYFIKMDCPSDTDWDDKGQELQNLILVEPMPEKVTIPVQKVWEDSVERSNRTSVKIRLKANGTKVKDITLPVDSNNDVWEYTFEELDKYDDNGNEINYTIDEVNVPEGYTKEVNGYTIKNILKTREITITKDWKGDGDNKTNRTDIEVKINRKTESYTNLSPIVKTLKKSNYSNKDTWTLKISDLPTHYKGEEITYTLSEYNPPKGYTSSKSGFTITNTLKTINIPVEKIWVDGNNTSSRKEVTVKLIADGTDTSQTVKLNSGNGWKNTFEGLPEFKNGKKIAYTIDESSVPTGYSKTNVDNENYKITNTKMTNITVTKKWIGDAGNENYRPGSITIKLYKTVNGKKSDTKQTLTLTGSKTSATWTGKFENLPAYDANGNAITYTIDEASVPTGYQKKEPVDNTNYIIENEFQSTDFTVTKRWLDGNKTTNRSDIKIILTGKVGNQVVVTESHTFPKNSTNWTHTFENLPEVDSNGKTITYSVDEESVPTGYAKSISSDGHTITNTKLIDIPVTKIWKDEIDKSNRTSVVIILCKNEKDTDQTITISGNNTKNEWTGKFEKLPEYDENNQKIEYSIKEKSVPAGYIKPADINGFTVTNTLETIDITITKSWEDENDRYKNRPNSVTINLYGKIDNGATTVKNEDIILSAKNNWKYTVTNLPTHNNGKKITYTIDEEKDNIPLGYIKKSVDNQNYIITNELERINIPVTKVWDDEIEKSNRNQPVKIILYQNGQAIEEKIMTGDKVSKEWKDQFSNLPKYINKKLVTYTIDEVPDLIGYNKISVDNQNYKVTNQLKVIDISVKKAWYDDNNYDKQRPAQVTIRLYENGKSTNKTLILKSTGGWTGKFTNLPEYKNCEKVNYTVKEEISPETYKYEPVTQGNMEDGYTITNIHEVQHPGYVEITGTVWHDEKIEGKVNTENGELDGNDKKMAGIKVVLKDANGTPMKCTYTDQSGNFTRTDYAVTKSDGTYKIRVNYDNSRTVYKLFEDASQVAEKLKTAYVEFEYNANQYTTVKTGTSGKDTSKAKENEDARKIFDNKYGTVTSQTNVNTINAEKMTAKTKDVISFANYTRENTKRNVTIRYCSGGSTHTRTNYEGAWLEPLTANNDEIIHSKTCPKNKHILKEQEIEVQIIENINLGLMDREQPDVAIFSDISKVKVTMKGQEYTYLYGVRNNEKNAVGIQTKFQEKDSYIYKRPVNPADIAYVNKVDNNAMSVEVTYEVRVANLSTTLPVIINNIDVYFDSRYTLLTGGWTQSQKTDFKVAQYNGNNGNLNITLDPGTEKTDEKLKLTYTISQEAIQRLLNEDATLNHAVEISSYSTRYGKNTVYAEMQKGGRTGAYGGYDQDSHPGNAKIALKTGDDGIKRLYSTDSTGRIIPIREVEDDTDFAPSFVLTIDREKNKIISGNVWEDSDANPSDAYRLGDGKKSNTEKNVANVKVELYKFDNNGNLVLAKLYSIDESTNPVTIREKDAEIFTDANGNYEFGDSTYYSVPTDRYVIKYTYGHGISGRDGSIRTSTIDSINVDARNYKSTIINANSNLYPIFKGTINNDEEWHLNISKGETIAVDNMEQRVAIPDLQYNNFNNKINITASTKPFKMQVEFDSSENKSAYVDKDGKSTQWMNKLEVCDFGIIERAREDIFAETTVEYFKITLASGQVLLQGNPKNETLNYTKAVGLNQDISSGEAARNAFEKQITTEIDTELMQGAQLEIKYGLEVTNNSEIDIDYYNETNGQYKTEFYYFGTNTENSPRISSSINYVVDYLDNELIYKWENEEDWIKKSADELKDEGLISEPTYNAIKEKDYAVYITTKYSDLKPGETKLDYITAQKLLSNQEENIYDNHIEILKIDAKTARTQKVPGQNRDYKMGNYVPSLATRQKNTDINLEIPGLHEQDDDRIKIAITPPTGEANYFITYLIIGLAGLITIGCVITFIKKKVLTK